MQYMFFYANAGKENDVIYSCLSFFYDSESQRTPFRLILWPKTTILYNKISAKGRESYRHFHETNTSPSLETYQDLLRLKRGQLLQQREKSWSVSVTSRSIYCEGNLACGTEVHRWSSWWVSRTAGKKKENLQSDREQVSGVGEGSLE